MLAHEDVHQMWATVWRCSKELEKPSVVSLGESFPNIHGMLNWFTLLFFLSQMFDHSHDLTVHLTEDQV